MPLIESIGVFVFMKAVEYLNQPRHYSTSVHDPWETLDIPEAESGSPIPVIFGTRWLNVPNVVWYGDTKTQNVKVKEGSILPFGIGDKKTTVHQKYYMGMHLVLCHAPIDAVKQIRAEGATLYSTPDITTNTTISIDKENAFGGKLQYGGVVGDVDIEFGGAAQPINTYLSGILGSDIPAYRGVVGAVLNQCYVAAQSAEVRPWSFYLSNLDSNSCGPNSLDMNPAHIIDLCLTEPWGLGRDSADVDSTSFTTANTQLDTEELGLSLAWMSSAPIQELIENVLRHIMGVLYTDPEDGKFHLTLMRNGDSSALSLDETNVIEIISYSKPLLTELVNQVIVKYKSRDDRDQTITLHNQGLIEQTGVVTTQEIEYDMVVEEATAQKLAARDLRNLSTPLARIEMLVNREALDVRIGQIVTLTWDRYSLDETDFRVMEIDYGNLQGGEIRITAVEDIYGVDTAVYASPPATKWVNPFNEPADATNRYVYESPYWELIRFFGSTTTVWDEIADDAGWVQAAIEKPSGDAFQYEFWTRLTADSYDEEDDIADFSPTGTLTEDLDPEVTTSTTLTEVYDFDLVALNTYCIIGDEFCEVTAFNATTGAITLKRGVLDTVPVSHSLGDRVYFAQDATADDPTEYASADVVKSKALPSTSLGTLDIGDATEDTTTMDDRMYRPYPPGNFQLNSSAWPAFITGALTVTWAHRNRLTQISGFTQQDTGDIGPEATTTYTVKIWDEEDDLIVNSTGIATTSYALSIANEITLSALAAGARPNETMRVLVSSQRDGFDSWQEHDFVIVECRGYGMFYGAYYGE